MGQKTQDWNEGKGLSEQGQAVFGETLHDRFPAAVKGGIQGGALLARQRSSCG
jgi:hypothetical protein